MRTDGAGLALALAGLLAAGGLGAWLATRAATAERALRPPVVVLDLARAGRPADPPALEAALTRQAQAARRLAEAGYLVLDGQAVLAAPAELYLSTPAVAPRRE